MSGEEITFAPVGTVSRLTAGSSVVAGSTITAMGRYSQGHLVLQCSDTGTGGTSLLVTVQGSLDDGVSWFDLASFDSIIPADNDLTQSIVVLSAIADPGVQSPAKGVIATPIVARTQRPGLWANKMRLQETVVGTYSPGVTYSVRGYFSGD